MLEQYATRKRAEIARLTQTYNIHLIYIPAGLTSSLQPYSLESAGLVYRMPLVESNEDVTEPPVKRQRRSKKVIQEAWENGQTDGLSKCTECNTVDTTCNQHRCKLLQPTVVNHASCIKKQVIKHGLFSVLHPQYRLEVMLLLDGFVEQYTRILILGTRLLHMHITRLLTEGKTIPLTQNLVKQCLLAVTTPVDAQQPKLGDEDLKETYRLYYALSHPHSFHPPSATVLTTFSLQDAARSIYTSLNTMTKVHFETKHRQWVVLKLKNTGLFLGKTLQRVATVCVRAGIQTETDEGAMTQIVEVLEEKKAGLPDNRQGLASEIYESVVRQPREQVRTVWSDYQSKRSGKQEDTGTKSRESTLLPWLFYILQDYESYNSGLLNAGTPVKLYLLVPLVGFTSPMMPVSIKFWKYMAGKVGLGTEEWSDLFLFSRHLRTRPSLRMATTTWTYGVSISFVCE